MALESILDYTAVRVAGITGIKAAYSVSASDEGATAFPRSLDDGPVALVLPGDGDAEAGNWEQEVHDFDVEVWVPAADVPWAFKTLIPFAALFRTEFRGDVDNNATCDRLLYRGYRQPYIDDTAGKPFLVMSIQLQALEIYASHVYAV